MATQPIVPAAELAPAAQTRATLSLLELVIESSTLEHEAKESYARQLLEQELTRDQFQQDGLLARQFARSGLFADVKGMTEDQALSVAMTKIRMGRALRMNEADAMQYIYFTNGRPAIQNELIAIKLKQAGWDWDIDWSFDEHKHCTGCLLWPKKKDPKTGEYVPLRDRKGNDVSVGFSKREADIAKVYEKGQQIRLSDKWNFQSWAEDMYYWRSIARLKRRYAPEVLNGALSETEAEDAPPIVDIERPPAEAEVEQPPEAAGKRPKLRDKILAKRPTETARENQSPEVPSALPAAESGKKD